jgi:hypothetical protein
MNAKTTYKRRSTICTYKTIVFDNKPHLASLINGKSKTLHFDLQPLAGRAAKTGLSKDQVSDLQLIVNKYID